MHQARAAITTWELQMESDFDPNDLELEDFTNEERALFGQAKKEDDLNIHEIRQCIRKPKSMAFMMRGGGTYPRYVAVPIYVNQFNVMAMIDSGATITVISKRLAKTIKESTPDAKTEACQEEVEIFEGGKVVLKERMLLDIHTKKKGAKCWVYVSGTCNTPFDICLGDDVLERAEATLCYKLKTLELFKQVTSFMTRVQVIAKRAQLYELFNKQDFREAGGPHTA